MKRCLKRVHLVAFAAAAVLAAGATSLAATTGVPTIRSSARSTVPPAASPKRPQRSQVAKITALESALTAAKARVTALKKALAKAKKPAQKRALSKALARAQAKVKALQQALAKAKKVACGRNYSYVKGKCLWS